MSERKIFIVHVGNKPPVTFYNDSLDSVIEICCEKYKAETEIKIYEADCNGKPNNLLAEKKDGEWKF